MTGSRALLSLRVAAVAMAFCWKNHIAPSLHKDFLCLNPVGFYKWEASGSDSQSTVTPTISYPYQLVATPSTSPPSLLQGAKFPGFVLVVCLFVLVAPLISHPLRTWLPEDMSIFLELSARFHASWHDSDSVHSATEIQSHRVGTDNWT